MRNKRGFTLIELLAVIVVLAIIALIATPIVMNTINNAKKGATERSGENYIKQVEVAIATKRLEEGTSNLSSLDGTYTINSDGNLEKDGLCEPLVIEVSGNRPTSGTIIVKDGEVQANSTMTIGDYSIVYSDGKCTLKTYTNGEVVYFDVTTGNKCTDYKDSNSNTGYNGINPSSEQTSCLKFYAFNDNGEDTVNLILDHNTTATVAWNSSNSNADGPKEVLEQLRSDTESWQGTITPSNYTMDQSTQSSKAKYTIDYSGYKARLITAGEIATITGNTGWDETKAANIKWYYVHDNTKTQYKGSAGTNKYAWLFDNTSRCTIYGCNVAGSNTYGYWTASSLASYSNGAWYVDYFGGVYDYYVDGDGHHGVRPVITVLKSKLS